jgi:hypothetical protein
MAVLLSRGWRRALQVAAGWYALVLVASLLVSPADLHAGALRVWPSLVESRADHVCVTCGLTRSFSAMSRADVAAAAGFNAAGPALYAIMLAVAALGVGSSAAEIWRAIASRRAKSRAARAASAPPRIG